VAFSADQIGDERILNPRYAWHGMWFPPCRSTQTAWEQKHKGGVSDSVPFFPRTSPLVREFALKRFFRNHVCNCALQVCQSSI
jgi:hypothetical protein